MTNWRSQNNGSNLSLPWIYGANEPLRDKITLMNYAFYVVFYDKDFKDCIWFEL